MCEEGPDPYLSLERKFFQIGGSGHILDYGCGKGGTMKRLSPNNKIRIIGLDVSTPNLKRAKKFGMVIRGSGDKLPFKEESFDAIIAYNVLHHMPNFRRALKEINKALKKGGLLLLSETIENNPFIKIGRFLYPYFEDMSVLSRFNLNELERLIKYSGFRILFSFTDFFLWGLVYHLGRIIPVFKHLKRLAINIDKNRMLSRFHGHYHGLLVKI